MWVRACWWSPTAYGSCADERSGCDARSVHESVRRPASCPGQREADHDVLRLGTSPFGFSLTDDLIEPWDNVGVKQFLILLLLLWMPLQASLAAFEEVHAHHDHASMPTAHAHDGSTVHEHSLTLGAANELADCRADCTTSHLCSAQLVLLHTEFAHRMLNPSSAMFAGPSSALSEHNSERPERPQWIASSH